MSYNLINQFLERSEYSKILKKPSINTVTDFNNTMDKNIIAVPCF